MPFVGKTGISLIAGILLLVGLGRGDAETFLSLAEAQKICFPEAGQFEQQVISLTYEQARTIGKEAKVKVKKREVNFQLALQGKKLLGILVLDAVPGKHNLIDYVVALNPDGKVVQVEILEYREKYGGQIRESKWRAQFQGKSARAPVQLNHDISNISGATISCRNVTDGVRRVLATYDLVLGPWLRDSGRLP